MAIENEVKIILNTMDDSLESLLSKVEDVDIHHIQQGYLDNNARLRQFECLGHPTTYVFTYKKQIRGKLFEAEYSMDEKDFKEFWGDCKRKLIKTRYILPKNLSTGETWMIDFLKTKNFEPYISLAECEMDDPNQEQPTEIPEILKPFVLYQVPRDKASTYTNRKLADKKTAKQLLEKLKTKAK